ncbi:MAG: hypothetical protein II937_09625 [Bacteroidales bacterium]|nr:hypothetical protein [Bacteroidales bacterium]
MEKIFKYEKADVIIKAKYNLYYRFAEVFIQRAHEYGILDVNTYVDKNFDYHKLGDLFLIKGVLMKIVKRIIEKNGMA